MATIGVLSSTSSSHKRSNECLMPNLWEESQPEGQPTAKRAKPNPAEGSSISVAVGVTVSGTGASPRVALELRAVSPQLEISDFPPGAGRGFSDPGPAIRPIPVEEFKFNQVQSPTPPPARSPLPSPPLCPVPALPAREPNSAAVDLAERYRVANAWCRRARLLAESGQFNEANEAFKTAIKLHFDDNMALLPHDPHKGNFLGQIFLELGIFWTRWDLGETRSCFLKAVELEKTRPLHVQIRFEEEINRIIDPKVRRETFSILTDVLLEHKKFERAHYFYTLCHTDPLLQQLARFQFAQTLVKHFQSDCPRMIDSLYKQIEQALKTIPKSADALALQSKLETAMASFYTSQNRS
jgi:hypothetical protein